MKNSLKTFFVALSVTTALVDVASASDGMKRSESKASPERDRADSIEATMKRAQSEADSASLVRSSRARVAEEEAQDAAAGGATAAAEGDGAAAGGGGGGAGGGGWVFGDQDFTSRVLSSLPPQDRARFGLVSKEARRQLSNYREGGAELSDTVEKYLRYVILGEGAAPIAFELSILRRDPKATALHIQTKIKAILPHDQHVLWELDGDVTTARAYFQSSALTPEYIERRVLDVIRGVNNDILEHIKHRVIISSDDTLTNAEVRAFYDEYQTLDEALPAGAAVKRFVIAPHNHASLRWERLPNFNANPAVTLVVSFDGVAIPDGWRVPRNVRRLAIIGPNVERIGDSFLCGCANLSELDLRPLDRVTSIGNDFLISCVGLTSLDLSALASVTRIGNGFLSECYGLRKLDLRPLDRVTSIGDDFLSESRSLRELDLSPRARVTSIGSRFLRDCWGLPALDLKGLANVTSIGDEFLGGCVNLKELDLRPLANVTSIGSRFLRCCWGLTALDLRGLDNVTSIGNEFLEECRGVTALDLRPLARVTSIGYAFLGGCSGLTALDLRPLARVTSFGELFLGGCRGLTALDLRPLTSVTSIGWFFLMGCTALESVNIKGLSPTIKAHLREQLSREGTGPIRIIEE